MPTNFIEFIPYLIKGILFIVGFIGFTVLALSIIDFIKQYIKERE